MTFNERIYSIADIASYFLFSVLSALLLFLLYSMNKQLEILQTNLKLLQNQVVDLQKDNEALVLMINEKNNIIVELQSRMSVSASSVVANSDVIMHNNNMIQFYIKAAGVVVVGALIVVLLNNIGVSSISFKSFIPKSAYDFIQDNTPFFQTHKFYFYRSVETDTSWRVDVVNEKFISISVKENNCDNFQSLSEYLMKWQQKYTAAVDAVAKASMDQTLNSVSTNTAVETVTALVNNSSTTNTAVEALTTLVTNPSTQVAAHHSAERTAELVNLIVGSGVF